MHIPCCSWTFLEARPGTVHIPRCSLTFPRGTSSAYSLLFLDVPQRDVQEQCIFPVVLGRVPEARPGTMHISCCLWTVPRGTSRNSAYSLLFLDVPQRHVQEQCILLFVLGRSPEARPGTEHIPCWSRTIPRGTSKNSDISCCSWTFPRGTSRNNAYL